MSERSRWWEDPRRHALCHLTLEGGQARTEWRVPWQANRTNFPRAAKAAAVGSEAGEASSRRSCRWGPTTASSAVLREILSVRARLQQLEDLQITAALSGPATGARMTAAAYRLYRPEELPEGGEGGGGGFHWPGGWPGERPYELPYGPDYRVRIEALEAQVSELTAALKTINAQVGRAGGQVSRGLRPPILVDDDPPAALARRLRDGGILRSTPAQPVLHRNGSSAPWMFYSWGVTTTADGLQLAARCLLDRLDTFESTQIAGHGMTAMPLVSACVALGGGRYSGLAIRKERKAYLSGRQVEGTLDPDRPVVVVDDSLSSGTALRQAISALEAAGATVEGAVALVGFPGRGGLEAASANGYRVETVLDITADLGMPLFSKPPTLPDLATDPAARLPEGLAPAALARLTARHVLARHTSPVPPATIAGSPDGRGGVFVSFRRRDDDHRLARDGFWHFDPDEFSPAADVVAATVRTIRTCQGAVSTANLELLKIGVTFLGPMEQIRPAELDFARFAIVVTDVPRVRAGGALPNSQVFTSEVQQYRHAQQRNAGLSPTEPHLLYRQTVSKDIEDDQRWPAYGAADPPSLGWATDPAVGAALLSRRAIPAAHGRGPEAKPQPRPVRNSRLSSWC